MNHTGVLLRLAARNVVRQRRRSALIALAMGLGVALLIVFLAVGDGMHAQWIDAGVRLGDGHVTVETPAYRRSASLDDRVDSATAVLAGRAAADPSVTAHVVAAAPRLTVSALASSASSALPVRAIGVDPAAESRFSILPGKLVAGRFLADTDALAAVVGQGVVDRLGLRLGSRFVLTAPTTRGDVQEQLVHVVGIFHTGIRDVDEGMIDVPIATARRWLAAPGAVTSLALQVDDASKVDGTVRALRSLLPARVTPFTWRETAPELDAAVRVDNLGSYLFNTVLLAIVSLSVLEALLVSVLHRRREFGVLRAMGLSARETGVVVLGEGLMLAGASGALGMAVGLGLIAVLGHTGLDLTAAFGDQLSISGALVSPVIHPTVQPARAWQGTIVVLVLGTLSSIYPMWQASRIDVASAMQNEQ